MAKDPYALRAKIALACRILAVEGLAEGTLGHVSARLGDDRMLLRCRGRHERGLLFTTADDIREVDLDGVLTSDDPGWTVPNEFRIHGETYRLRPEVQSVVHAHPPMALLAGLADLPLTPVFGAYNGRAMMVADELARFMSSGLVKQVETARELVETMAGRRACLMRGHGIVVTGESVEDATVRALDVETLARIHVELARLHSSPAPVSSRDFADVEDGARGGAGVWSFYAARASLLLGEPKKGAASADARIRQFVSGYRNEFGIPPTVEQVQRLVAAASPATIEAHLEAVRPPSD